MQSEMVLLKALFHTLASISLVRAFIYTSPEKVASNQYDFIVVGGKLSLYV